ncbi:MAG: 2OG-Fe dioxygenase family protein, partial [Gammaproteobacteria bacterium]|nr:2OG-Fe dioxygenase family protein [Gammaproteobacteria bacterium]
QGSRGVRFTMVQPWSMLLLDDAQVIHETTPIQAEIADGAPGAARAVRDKLVLTYRAGGFQEPAAGG